MTDAGLLAAAKEIAQAIFWAFLLSALIRGTLNK